MAPASALSKSFPWGSAPRREAWGCILLRYTFIFTAIETVGLRVGRLPPPTGWNGNRNGCARLRGAAVLQIVESRSAGFQPELPDFSHEKAPRLSSCGAFVGKGNYSASSASASAKVRVPRITPAVSMKSPSEAGTKAKTYTPRSTGSFTTKQVASCSAST